MTMAQLERRLSDLEEAVRALQSTERQPRRNGQWWIEHSGQYARDPVYQEIVRRGQEYRQSLRDAELKPKARRKRKR